MATKQTDIYGRDPDGGAKEAAAQAMSKMKSMGVTSKQEKCKGDDASHNDLEHLK